MSIVYVPGLLPDKDYSVKGVSDRISGYFGEVVTVVDYNPLILSKTGKLNPHFSEDVKQLYSETVKGDVDIAWGHSTGGSIITTIAKDAPPSEALVISSGAFEPIDPKQFVENAILKKNGKLDYDIMDMTPEQAKVREKEFMSNLMTNPIAYYRLLLNSAKLARDAAKFIDCPVLMLHGDKDILARQSGADKISKTFQNAKLIKYAGLQHHLLETKGSFDILDDVATFRDEVRKPR